MDINIENNTDIFILTACMGSKLTSNCNIDYHYITLDCQIPF